MTRKVHMKAAVDRDIRTGKVRTLCGRFVDESLYVAENPDGERDVNCRDCRSVLNEFATEAEVNGQTKPEFPQLNMEIRVKIVTDMGEIARKGHEYPVVELYNDVINTWIPATELSFSRLQEEIAHLEKVTGWHDAKPSTPCADCDRRKCTYVTASHCERLQEWQEVRADT